MSDCNSTDDRRSARVDAILTAAFPLAATPDFQIGPLPLFKIRNLLLEASSDQGADPAEPDDHDAETMLCQIGAILAALGAMANDRESLFDAESAQWLVTLGRDLVRRLLPAGGAP